MRSSPGTKKSQQARRANEEKKRSVRQTIPQGLQVRRPNRPAVAMESDWDLGDPPRYRLALMIISVANSIPVQR